MTEPNWLARAINSAEMTGISPEDQWIRTKAFGSASSAYGPCQLTKGLALGYLRNHPNIFTDVEKKYLERFIEQGKLFLRYGGGDWKKYPNGEGGYTQEELRNKFEYGREGILTSFQDKELYWGIINKMLYEIWQRNGEDLNKVWREWRFGTGSSKEDPRYERQFFKSINSNG